MSVVSFETELNGYADQELELIRFEYLFGVRTLVEKVTVPKFRAYGDVRDSAINASHEIERGHAR
jgi:hypothetical protein